MSRRRSSPGAPATGSAPNVSSPDPIERIAFLLGPPGGPAVFVPAADRWQPPPVDETRTVLWGRSAAPSGTPPWAAMRGALARERGLRRAARRRGRIHRIPPQTLSAERMRNAIRSRMLGGAIVAFPVPGSDRRVIDEAASAAGVTLDAPAGLHLSSSGSVLARVRVRDGEAVLRVGAAGAPGDPSHGATALAHLSALDLPVPRLLRTGETSGASWSLETALPGGRPTEISPGLTREVVGVLSALPPGIGPPGGLRRDLEALATLLPDRADRFRALADAIRAELRSLPSVMRHGDLWAGNLLADHDSLTGVVDWDAWDPGAVPGADLLHLHATGRRIEEHAQLGEIWDRRPWKDDAYRALVAGPAAAIPDDVLSIAWWACEVRGTVSRHPARAVDDAWLGVNVDAVLRTLRP